MRYWANKIPQNQDYVEFLGLEKGEETLLLLVELVSRRRRLILVLRLYSGAALDDGHGGILGQRRGCRLARLHGDLILGVGHGDLREVQESGVCDAQSQVRRYQKGSFIANHERKTPRSRSYEAEVVQTGESEVSSPMQPRKKN